MEDGIIANNEGVGVDAAIGGNAVVQLKGGDIYGNGDGTEVTVWNDYTDAPAAYGQAESDNLFIGEGVSAGCTHCQSEAWIQFAFRCGFFEPHSWYSYLG